MRKFKEVLKILKNESSSADSLKKIYFLGSTGAGKTSIIKNILGTAKDSFPNVSQTRTTVVPTEYIISKKFIQFKTIILFKTKQDIKNSIDDIVREAIIEASLNNDLENIKDKLRERSDEKFKLFYLVEDQFFQEIAKEIIDINIEDDSSIDKIVDKLLKKIEENFSEVIKEYKLFENENKPYVVTKENKEDFIKYNQSIFRKDFKSISILCEYIRIEGNFENDFIENDFVLIDGEGIGHSLKEKRDTLSIRHFDFFNYCDLILLVEKADDPFISGGQGAIESIILNGYSDKLKIAFTKIDKIELKDKNYFLRKRLNNLKDALKDHKIHFDFTMKNIYKFEKLDKIKMSELTKKELVKFQKDIQNTIKQKTKILEYDFDDFLLSIDTDKFVSSFVTDIDNEHWMRIKAFTKRMLQGESEYLYIKPISWVLGFLMKEINIFLDKLDEPTTEVIYSKDKIKQEVSKSIIKKFEKDFIKNKINIWQKALEESGKGSHQKRKEWIYKYILNEIIPARDSKQFKDFVLDIKSIVLEAGVIEKKKAKQLTIKSMDIQKIYHKKDIQWNLNNNINILLGKNGSGKSTVARLIYAFLSNNQEIMEKYEFPAISMDIIKHYEDSSELLVLEKANDDIIDTIYIDTLDKKIRKDNLSSLDSELDILIQKLGEYQRKLNIEFEKEIKDFKPRISEILDDIQNADIKVLEEFKELKTKEEKIKYSIFSKIYLFKNIVDEFLQDTNKSVVLDNEEIPLLVEYDNGMLNYKDLSSGEKQLIVIFLNILLAKDNSIIIMDEPELSLHVNWQLKLIESILKLNSKAQYIIVTHNPILVLNRDSEEISIIKNNEIIKYNSLSKYMDISTILIEVFNIDSLVGRDMEELIEKYNNLQTKDTLTQEDKKEIEDIKVILNNNFTGDFIYNKIYFEFLKFMKTKDITKKDLTQDDLEKLLSEFGDFI